MDPFETRLRLAPHLALATPRADSVFLIDASRAFRVKDALQAALLERADGLRTGGELMLELEERFGGAQVLYALRRLHERGVLVPAELELSAAEAAFWSPHGLEQGGLGRLRGARVGVECVEGTALPASAHAAGEQSSQQQVAEQLRQMLRGAGLKAPSAETAGTVTLLLTTSYVEARFLERLRELRARSGGVLPARLIGAAAWLGPLFAENGEGPCPTCLRDSLERNRPIVTFLSRQGHTGPEPPSGHTEASLGAAASFVAQRLAHTLVKGELAALEGRLQTLDLRSFELTEHAVLRRPQCPDCGEPERLRRQMDRPVELLERSHAHGDDGGYRTVSPEETYQRYRALVSPLTGVLTSLGELAERSHPLLPVYAAGYFVCPQSADSDPGETFDRASLGKGRSHAQSRASALCEGLERYAAVWQGDEAFVRKSFAELAPDAIDPRLLQNFSELQYQNQTSSDTGDRRRKVPLPFDPDQVIHWSPAWSLTHRARRWLPTAYCFTHVPVPADEYIAFYNPNGHAAGNCLEEAVLQGFLELVERDAAAVWWYNRVQRPKVDLASFHSEYFRQVMELDASRGLDMHVLDITHDLGIPVMVAVGIEPHTGRYFMGFGCHLDAELAIQRSLTELHQVYDPTGRGECPFRRADFDDDSFWHPMPGAGSVKSIFERHAGKSLKSAVETCVERVARAGMETIVLDYTRPDIGLPTVKVVVPGLRHFWPRLGPGRLYDVPCQLGWLERPRAESELNPVPLLI